MEEEILPTGGWQTCKKKAGERCPCLMATGLGNKKIHILDKTGGRENIGIQVEHVEEFIIRDS